MKDQQSNTSTQAQVSEALSRPNIFEYQNYRLFVRDFIQFLKQSPDFSFRKWARFAGIPSAGLIFLIIQEKTGISERSAIRLARGFQLRRQETQYFLALVKENQSRSESERSLYRELMESISRYSQKRELSEQDARYYEFWFLPVLREMIALKTFRADPKWISEQLAGRISPEEAILGIEKLEELGLIQFEHGRWIQKEALVSSTKIEKSEEISFFHIQMLELAKQQQTELPKDRREISCLTLTTDRESFEQIQKEIVEFRRQLFLKYGVTQEQHDNVVQIGFQLFPLLALKN